MPVWLYIDNTSLDVQFVHCVDVGTVQQMLISVLRELTYCVCTVLQVFVILHKLTVDVLLIYCFESAASVEVGFAHSAQA